MVCITQWREFIHREVFNTIGFPYNRGEEREEEEREGGGVPNGSTTAAKINKVIFAKGSMGDTTHAEADPYFDPAKIPCPDFSSNLYDVICNALIADANTPDIANNEQAILKLRSQWEAENANLRAQYQAQLQEKHVAVEQRRVDKEESTRQCKAEEREKEAELAKAIEKKHTPLPNFKQGVGLLRSCTPCNRARGHRCLRAGIEWDSSEVIDNTAVTPLVPGDQK
ncbi:hypothetical protein F5876DRAFT_70029 [Lentinula aff. lateritia]|uniref:Uncharacterized protein n=1 Tax=Lentinula aff. lateritia TaxID=2804960 RepID=A0ACC1TKU1_9AGAR|nr:hypothetical protein F5876DRAFT_70029 [Lentinula aff. lateritia]